MKLPDGEHLIEDKIYVVKDGEVVEIKDVQKELHSSMQDIRKDMRNQFLGIVSLLVTGIIIPIILHKYNLI